MNRLVLDARTATDHFPGIGRYVVNLASALKRVSPDLDLALLRDPSAPAQRLTLPDLPVLDCAVSPFALAQQWRVRPILRQSRAALYHSAYYLMPYAPGVPAVVTCYDLIPLIYPQYFTATQRLIFRTAHLLALRTARVTLAISEATKNDLVRFFRVDPRRIVVTPPAVDDHFKPPSCAEVERVRAQYALPDRCVLYLGSNKPHKNAPRLVEAFAQLGGRDQELGIGLVIAGHWDQRYPQAKELAERLNLKDNVRFIGPVADADMPAVYGGAAVFVFPSHDEGFGLPVLEAIACGAPAICGDQSSLREVAGEAALLCDPDETEALSRTIEQVIADRALSETLHARWQGDNIHALSKVQSLRLAARSHIAETTFPHLYPPFTAGVVKLFAFPPYGSALLVWNILSVIASLVSALALSKTVRGRWALMVCCWQYMELRRPWCGKGSARSGATS